MYIITGIWTTLEYNIYGADVSPIFFWFWCWWTVLGLKIIDIFKALLMPIFRFRLAFYLIKIGRNPWTTKAGEIVELSEEEFEGLLKMYNKKRQEEIRNFRKTCKRIMK